MRKTLLSCALMLLFSAVMLFGTTYAWFTDDLVVEDNSVILGKLEMEVKYGDPTENENGLQVWYDFDGTELFDVRKDNYGKYLQPGSIIERVVKVKNTGNIDMAVNLSITNRAGNIPLEISIKYDGEEIPAGKFVPILVDEEKVFTVTVKVPTYLGNDYMEARELFDFKIHAEQLLKVRLDTIGSPIA